MVNGRKNWNFIPSIRHKNVAFTNSYEIGQIFTMRFLQQFGIKRASRFRVNFKKLLENKWQVDLSHLEQPFMLKEIKGAVFELGGDKAPGTDGFPL